MWVSKVRCRSNLTPRLVTDVERGMFWPEKVMWVMGDDWTWFGVPTKIASVFELFSCRKFSRIQAFISSMQLLRGDGEGDGDDDGDSDDVCGIGSVFIYSCVSSA